MLIIQAQQIDPGFEPAVLASMIATLDRFSDNEIPIDSDAVTELRTFFQQWRQELSAGQIQSPGR